MQRVAMDGRAVVCDLTIFIGTTGYATARHICGHRNVEPRLSVYDDQGGTESESCNRVVGV